MAGGPEDPVASGAMEISPGLDAVPARPDTEPADASAVAPVEPDEEITAEQVSLSRRLRQPRTIISILIPLVIIAAFIGINGAALAKVPGLIAGANPVLVAAAFGIFYLGFPLRGWRWKALLRGTDFIIGTKDSTGDHLPVLAGQLRGAGEAGRPVSRLSPQDQQHGVAEQDLRDRVHRARPRRDRDRPARDPGRLLELPRRPAAGGPGRVRDRPGRRRSCWSSACSRCATSGARS